MYKTSLMVSAIALAAVSANAQETETQATSDEDRIMETVQVVGQLSGFGATKSATPILETARSISIETDDQFRDKGALTLDDTLNYTSGVVGDTFGFSTRGDFPKVRGFDAAEYRDGQQVLFGFYNNTRSDVYMLEQVEVLKGPASVLYGKGTPGGIVNAVSKLAGPNEDSEVVFDLGSNNRYQGALDYNTSLSDNVFVRLVGLYRNSDTQVDFVEDDALIIMPSITYDNGTTRLTAMLEYSDREGDTSHQFLPLTGTACATNDVTLTPTVRCALSNGDEIDASTYHGNPDFNRYDTNSTLISLLGSHEFTENFSVDGIFRYKDGEADYRQAWIAFTNDLSPRIDASGNGPQTYYRSDATSEQTALDVRARYTIETGVLQHEILGGIALQKVETTNDGIFLPGSVSGVSINAYNPEYDALTVPAFVLNDDNLADFGTLDAEDLGLYISNQISVGDLKVNVGLRWDQVETTTGAGSADDDATSFSIGALYTFAGGISPYISYAESFEPVIGTDGIGGGPLEPQEGEQFEVGLKYQPSGTRTYITAAYFDIEQSNLIDPQATPQNAGSQQQGVAEVQGFEIEAQTQIGDVYLEGNFSTLETETVDGVSFDSIPDQQASAWVQYEPSDGMFSGFRIGAGLRYTSENESNIVGPTGTVLTKVVTDGTVLGDFLVGYATDEWDLSLNVRNIADEAYYGTCLARGDCYPGEERTIVARLARRF